MQCNMSWWIKVIRRHFWWQELRGWVLNYLICQGCGSCSLAAFPNLELRGHRGKVVVIVRGTVPCWICHRAKIHQSTSGDVILNVIFNWKINTKWHCPRLQFERIITVVSSSMLSKLLFIKLSGKNGCEWCVVPIHATTSPWSVHCPALKRRQVKLPQWQQVMDS